MTYPFLAPDAPFTRKMVMDFLVFDLLLMEKIPNVDVEFQRGAMELGSYNDNHYKEAERHELLILRQEHRKISTWVRTYITIIDQEVIDRLTMEML